MIEPTGTDPTRELLDRYSRHLPRRLRVAVDSALSQWPGRVLTATTSGFIRVELFDRSMAIAAQFFTSVFPTLIMLASWFGDDFNRIFDDSFLPEQTRELLQGVVGDTNDTAFGVLGAVLVLASATSLSRALTRAFAAIWLLPRPHFELASAWRWLVVILALAGAVVVAVSLPRLTDKLPPPELWRIVLSALSDVAVTLFVPWVLLRGRVPVRNLLPGAVLFAAVMLFLRPASAAWLPRTLEASADKYGAIGVAFTYLAWLYAIAFCWLTASVVGRVLATDPGWFGARIRGRRAAGSDR